MTKSTICYFNRYVNVTIFKSDYMSVTAIDSTSSEEKNSKWVERDLGIFRCSIALIRLKHFYSVVTNSFVKLLFLLFRWKLKSSLQYSPSTLQPTLLMLLNSLHKLRFRLYFFCYKIFRYSIVNSFFFHTNAYIYIYVYKIY